MILDLLDLDIVDWADYPFLEQIQREIREDYHLDLDWQPGDVMIDVGAHIGIVSLYVAKRYPFVKVYAYEPWPDNYRALVENLKRNGATNVKACDCAVAQSRGFMDLAAGTHTGERGAFHDVGERLRVRCITVPAILARHKLKRVRLLKLDCEGAEHGILAGSGSWIDKVDQFRIELHMNHVLSEMGFSKAGTLAMVPGERCRWQFAGDSELL